jgi:hypothetical protein
MDSARYMSKWPKSTGEWLKNTAKSKFGLRKDLFNYLEMQELSFGAGLVKELQFPKVKSVEV